MSGQRSSEPEAGEDEHAPIFLSRTQREAWESLRDNGMLETERMSRRTIDVLVHAGLAFERDSGTLCVSEKGRAVVRLVGNAVHVPRKASRA